MWRGGALLLAGLLAGCGSSSGEPPTAAPRQAVTHPLIVPNTHGSYPDSFYQPDSIRVRVGQIVSWTNKDSDPHDVTSLDGTFASGPIGAGGTYRWVATQAGTYQYFCTIHPEMHGTVVVTR